MGMGGEVRDFEQAFSAHLGVADFVMLNSGSSSLHLAVHLLGLARGSEVILPSFTWVACANVVELCGCVPVFTDVELDTQNISAATIEPLLTTKTAALMVVHYAGLPVEMAPIRELGVPVIEDAAHAVHSLHKGQPCGTMGDVGIFSFDAVKNLASPDGGGIVAGDSALLARARSLRYCGMAKSGFAASGEKERWWEHDVVEAFPRYISNDLSAAIALVQLKRLEALQARRREIWEVYQEAFAGLGWLARPVDASLADRHSYFTYLVRVLDGRRDALAKRFSQQRIYTTLRYFPLHLTKRYRNGRVLPNSERLAEEALNLPLHPAMTDSDVERVVDIIKTF